MPLIFLDCDGVLNSMRFTIHHYYNEPLPCVGAPNWRRSHIDPKAMVRLNEIIARTGSEVVVSSSWRVGADINEFRGDFDACGFKGTIIDFTPNLWIQPNRRGGDIHAWLVDRDRLTENFIILDDSSDIEPHMDRLVKTSLLHGLQDEHVEQAVKLLGF